MRALDTGALPDDDATAAEESSFCLGCRACEPVCPAGVQYGALLEEWRGLLWRRRRRPWRLRVLLWTVNRTSRVRLLGALRRHARTRRTGREAAHLMLGCFERALYPRVSRSAKRLAPELAAPASQGCCGALHAHNGDPDRGQELARELGRALPGMIVTTSGGCAAHLAAVLGPERVRELTQWLYERDSTAASSSGGSASGAAPDRSLRIAIQDSCHLVHGLGGGEAPRRLLSRAGEHVPRPSESTCCGAAGTYSLLRPRDSARVLDRHLDEIEAADVDVIAVVNPGCYRQLQQGLRRRGLPTRVRHVAELLAERIDERGDET